MALPDELFPDGLEPLLAAMAQRFAATWAEREVEILTSARAALLHLRTDPRRGDQLCLSLQVPPRIFERAAGAREAIERDLLSCARGQLPTALRDKLEAVSLGPLLGAERGWRERLKKRRAPGDAPRPRVAPPRREPPPTRRRDEVEVRPQAQILPEEERAPKDLRQLEVEIKEEKAARARRYKSFRIP